VCLRYKCKIINTTQKTDEDKIFLHGNSNWEKPQGGGGGKFTIIRRFTRITCMYWCFFELGSDGKPKVFVEGLDPFSPKEEGLFVLNYKP